MDKQLLKTIRFEEILQWDVKQFYITKISSKFRIDKLGNHIIHETKKYQLSNEPDKDFNILGVSNKEGMYDTYTLKGREIKQKYHKVEDDWLVYNPYRINVGSIGLKTKDLKGEYISPAYVVFSCKKTVLPEYIFFLIKTDTFNKLINDSTTGTVRQTLHFEKIAEINIPVPTINEQKEILKEYNDTLKEIEKLKEKLLIIERKKDTYLLEPTFINKNNRILNFVKYNNIIQWDIKRYFDIGYKSRFNLVPLSEVLYEPKIEWVNIENNREYDLLGVHAYGKGCYIYNTVKGSELTMKRYQKSVVNSLFWCKVRTVRGQFGIVYDKFANTYASTNMKYMSIKTSIIRPEFLEFLFHKNELVKYMDTLATGTNSRHFNPSVLYDIKIPLPTLQEQDDFLKDYNECKNLLLKKQKLISYIIHNIESKLFV